MKENRKKRNDALTTKYTEQSIIADWKTGIYNKVNLARKYSLSTNKISSIVKGIKRGDSEELIKKTERILLGSKYTQEIPPRYDGSLTPLRAEAVALLEESMFLLAMEKFRKSTMKFNRKLISEIQRKLILFLEKENISIYELKTITAIARDIEKIVNPNPTQINIQNSIKKDEITDIEVSFVEEANEA